MSDHVQALHWCKEVTAKEFYDILTRNWADFEGRHTEADYDIDTNTFEPNPEVRFKRCCAAHWVNPGDWVIRFPNGDFAASGDEWFQKCFTLIEWEGDGVLRKAAGCDPRRFGEDSDARRGREIRNRHRRVVLVDSLWRSRERNEHPE